MTSTLRTPVSVDGSPLALVLDFGAVITKSVFDIPQFVGVAFGLGPDVFPWRGPIAPETDDLWNAMQRDELTEREYWGRRAAQIGRLCGRELDTRAFMVETYEVAKEAGFRTEIAALVADARSAALKVGVLTNELELFHGKAWLETIPLLKQMDAIVDATHTLILKPDPRAYAAIADALGVPIGRAVFVDDQPRNIAGARAVGMPAVLFRIEDVPGSLAEIRELLHLPGA